MPEPKKAAPPVPLCRFEKLAERENRLREDAARKQKKPRNKASQSARIGSGV